jgi:hypothetical protein
LLTDTEVEAESKCRLLGNLAAYDKIRPCVWHLFGEGEPPSMDLFLSMHGVKFIHRPEIKFRQFLEENLSKPSMQHEFLMKTSALLSGVKAGKRDKGAYLLGYDNFNALLTATQKSALKRSSETITKMQSYSGRSRGLAAIKAAKTFQNGSQHPVKTCAEEQQELTMIEQFIRGERSANESKYALFVAAFVSGHESKQSVPDTPSSLQVAPSSTLGQDIVNLLKQDGSEPDDKELTAYFECTTGPSHSRPESPWWPWEKKKAWMEKKAMLEENIRGLAAELMRHQALAYALAPEFSGTAPSGRQACLVCHGLFKTCFCSKCENCGQPTNLCNYACKVLLRMKTSLEKLPTVPQK